MLTAVFFQIQAASREQEVPAVKSLHHTPPFPHHTPPCTMLTATHTPPYFAKHNKLLFIVGDAVAQRATNRLPLGGCCPGPPKRKWLSLDQPNQ
jgi:hypothetical protein